MQVEKIYADCNESYDLVLSQMRTAERVEKYINKFAVTPEYDFLMNAIEENNGREIFRYSHSLKGISSHLAFNKLYDASSQLCELFRDGDPDKDYSEYLDKVKEEYHRIISAIDNNR